MISIPPPSCRVFGFLCAASLLLAGCGTGGTSPGVLSSGSSQGPIVIDGSRHDWEDQSLPVADENYLYLPIRVEGALDPVQAMDESLVLLLDADGDPTTGARAVRPRVAATLGAELMIQFSPPGVDGPRKGVQVQAVDASGSWTNISHSDIGLTVLPTHASDWFEVRVDRQLAGVPDAPQGGMRSSGHTSGMWILYDGLGEMIGWSDPFTVALPRAAGSPPRFDSVLPARAAGAVRVVSYNVHGKMAANPEPFARMLDALDADIILLQEWGGGMGLSLETWLTANLASGAGWRTVMGDSPDVAIAARSALRPLGPGRIELPDSDRPVRFVGAVVQTIAGPMAVASVHLKCCGSADSPEDVRRQAEAEAINRALTVALASEEISARVVAGDLNLVGSRRPIDTLKSGLDDDGTDLDIIDALILGDASATTWFTPDGPFAPGRLDYVLVGEYGARVAGSFVFDTRVLGAAALARIGLDPDDSSVSDHLPVVVDIVPQRR